MIENIIFSLDRVMPFFLLIVLGVFLCKIGLVSQDFFKGSNSFVYRFAMPVQLFCNIATAGKISDSAGRLMLHVMAIILVSFAVVWAITEFFYRNQKELIGTLVQGGFRGNFGLIGAPLAIAVAGPSAVQSASLIIMVAIPTYNALSVVVLKSRGKNSEKQSVSEFFGGIVTNPLILGSVAALPFLFLGIKIPSIIFTPLNYVSNTVVPLGLLSVGGLLNFSDATARLRPALYSSLIKTLVLPLVAIFISYKLGFRGNELLVLLVLMASPVAISSYAMASEMGGDVPLASNIMILTTFFSGFFLAFGIYILKTFALI